MKCPKCGKELDEDNYCSKCRRFFKASFLEDFSDFDEELDDCYDDEDYLTDEELDDCYDDEESLQEVDYDSMVNNGDSICLNCTFWSVSPYGASHGMVCRKGQISDGPADSCGLFVQQHHFASYGSSGQYQFDETTRAISNKLYHWKNNR